MRKNENKEKLLTGCKIAPLSTAAAASPPVLGFATNVGFVKIVIFYATNKKLIDIIFLASTKNSIFHFLTSRVVLTLCEWHTRFDCSLLRFVLLYMHEILLYCTKANAHLLHPNDVFALCKASALAAVKRRERTRKWVKCALREGERRSEITNWTMTSYFLFTITSMVCSPQCTQLIEQKK